MALEPPQEESFLCGVPRTGRWLRWLPPAQLPQGDHGGELATDLFARAALTERSLTMDPLAHPTVPLAHFVGTIMDGRTFLDFPVSIHHPV